jgi:hypothetical protein
MLPQSAAFNDFKESRLPLHKDNKMTISKHEPNENIRSQSIILQEGPGLATVVVPTTAESAAWWSQGTEWSFRDAKNGSFTQHNKESPIVMIVESDGSKLCLIADKAKYMCMGANTSHIKPESVPEGSTLYPVLQWASTLNSRIDRLMKGLSEYKEYNYNDTTSCRESVQDDGMNLGRVPTHLRTPDLCELAVEQNGAALSDVPVKLRTPELCRIAVVQNGMALNAVPEDLRTKEICELALQDHADVLASIPKAFITKEMCELAVQQNGYALNSVPMKLRTKEICKLAVQNRAGAFRWIPETFKEELRPIAEQALQLQKENSPRNEPQWPLSMLNNISIVLRLSRKI